MMTRREFHRAFFGTAMAGVVGVNVKMAHAAPPATAPATTPANTTMPSLKWADVREWGIEGRGFTDTAAYFDRLPERAKNIVRDEVCRLSRQTAGMSVRFATNSPSIAIQYELTNETLAMPHMQATGVSGMDLYGQIGDSWNWAGTIQPKTLSVEGLIGKELEPGMRSYLIDLPLYNGVKSMSIGVEPGAAFVPTAPRSEKPILFYGTSITQGACASRPGMAFTNILGRRLGKPILNFGFSGNGRMEMEVGNFLAEIEPSVFVLDCVANTTLEQIGERSTALVKMLKTAHPKMPVLIVEDRDWANAALSPKLRETQKAKRATLAKAFKELQNAGIEGVRYRDASNLIGTDGEGTVDGSHPNDLGMMRYADGLESAIRSLI